LLFRRIMKYQVFIFAYFLLAVEASLGYVFENLFQ
jgi:hypothetical protein